MLCHAFAVSRCRLLDLMQARRVNQELKAQSLGVSVVLFLAGAGLLAVAYAMLLTRGLDVYKRQFLDCSMQKALILSSSMPTNSRSL